MNRLTLSINCVQFRYVSGMRERENGEGERNKLNNNMISSWIIFISTWWNLPNFIIEFIQFAEWYWGLSLFFNFGQLKWIISFQFNHYFFRAVNHFHLWSHHRHLKSHQMNRLSLSISYLQFISSWDWERGRGRECV